LKPEWWVSQLVQEEKYQEKPVKRGKDTRVVVVVVVVNYII
jgi:hypothetical protein